MKKTTLGLFSVFVLTLVLAVLACQASTQPAPEGLPERVSTNPSPSSSPSPEPAELPDLVVLSAKTHPNRPFCYGPHTRVGALVVIGNNGSADAGQFSVTVSGVAMIIDGLEAGGSTELWLDADEFAPPWSTIAVVVDPDNMVAESDEGNNQLENIVLTLTPEMPCTPTANP